MLEIRLELWCDLGMLMNLLLRSVGLVFVVLTIPLPTLRQAAGAR